MYGAGAPTRRSYDEAQPMSHVTEARALLRRCRSGSLATLSRRLPGYPYVSIVPFMLDHAAHPILLISRLAEHTKNIAADKRVSLAAQEPTDDIQATARLSLCGTCTQVDDRDAIAARYLRFFPGAARLLELDFDFYRISPNALRFVGGFGAVHWITAESFKPDSGALAAIEDDVLAHMNNDHVPALHDYCRHIYGVHASAVTMIGIDCDGFDARADNRLLRFEFPHTVHDPTGVRATLLELARTCRA